MRHIEDVYNTTSAILALVQMVETCFDAVDALLQLAGDQRAADAEQSVDSPLGEYRERLVLAKSTLENSRQALTKLAEVRDALEQSSSVAQRAAGVDRVKHRGNI